MLRMTGELTEKKSKWQTYVFMLPFFSDRLFQAIDPIQ